VPILSAGNHDSPLTWNVSHEMNHREPPQLPVGVRRALRCLSLLLVPALTLDQGHAGTRLRSTLHTGSEPTPYLPVVGSMSLRFEEALPPADLVSRPAAAAPPVAALSPAESSVAVANSDAARSTAVAPDDTSTVKTVTPPPAPVGKTPAPILPDALHPIPRAEDFLPYFQIPGSAKQVGDVNIITPAPSSVPAPAPLPPSSATYTQPSR
jgi:hypothetical protein